MRTVVPALANLAAVPPLALNLILPTTLGAPAALIVGVLLASIACAWAQVERVRASKFERMVAAEQIRSRVALFMRDGLLNSALEGVVVWEPQKSEPLSFGGGLPLLHASLAGDDSAKVSTVLARLREQGVIFGLDAREKGGGLIKLRGCLIGACAAVFLHRESAESHIAPRAESSGKQASDRYIHALDDMPLAIALFGSDRRLEFYNRSYARLFRLPKAWLDSRPTESEILDRLRELRQLPEQSDFAAWKRDRLKLFPSLSQEEEELWHLPDGTTLRVNVRREPSGGFFYFFEDVSERLRQKSAYNAFIKVQQATLDTLQEGVAVFGTDGRLKLHNSAFARAWRLSAKDLSNGPHLNEIRGACARQFGRDGIWDTISRAVTSASPEQLDGPAIVERSDGRIVSFALSLLPDGATLITFADLTDSIGLKKALVHSPTVA